jgi:hypothetical protein
VNDLILKARARSGTGRLRFLVAAAVSLVVVGSAITANPVAAAAPPELGGRVVVWGDNDGGRFSVPDGLDHVVAISASGGAALALRSDGTVVSWGRDASGKARVPTGLSDVTAVSAGKGLFLALRKNGEVVTLGGDANEIVATQAVAIVAGDQSGIALERDGTIVTIGRINPNTSQIHNGVALSTGQGAWYAITEHGDPVLLAGYSDSLPRGIRSVTAISTSVSFGLALKTDGTIVSWGLNNRDQQNVPAINDATAIATGDDFGLALRANGTIVAWGDNNYGQLNIPEGLSQVTAIAAGNDFGLAVTDAPAKPNSTQGLPNSAFLIVGFETIATILFLGSFALLLTVVRRGWLAGTKLVRLMGALMPTAIALALAVLSMPLVVATFDPSDGTSARGLATPTAIWAAAAGSVLVSALVASIVGAPMVRIRPVLGAVATFVVALLVAIPSAALLPSLLGQRIALGWYCFFTCQTAYSTQYPPGALAADLFLPLAPLVEPVPVALLAIGVSIWTVLVRQWPDASRSARLETPSQG